MPYGGTCALRGCDPKKLLRRGPEIMDAASCMDGRGIVRDSMHIDWPALVAFKRRFTDPIPERREKSFEDRGIATSHGTARFTDRTTVTVGDTLLEGRHIVIATGARPRPLGMSGEDLVTTNTGFMELPRRVLFIGDGYISFEFAHMAARAGAAVRVLTRGARPLKGFDPDLVEQLVGRSRAVGISLHTHADVQGIEKAENGLHVHSSVAGRDEVFVADLVVHGAKRIPAIGALDLDKANIRSGKAGITVNEFLQSVSNPAVYAAGDAAATDGPPLTPVSSLEGKIAAANLLEGNHARAN